MKGFFTQELLAIIFVAVLVVGVLMLWFTEEARVKPDYVGSQPTGCEKSSDCSGEETGSLCLSIQSSPTFCGCIDDNDCETGKTCTDNRCK